MADETGIEALQAELAELRAQNQELRLRLDVLSTLDPATGLLNSHGVEEALAAAAARGRRTGEPFGLMLVGFPGLLRIAAEAGQEAAGEELRHVGAMVTATLRAMDRVGRYDESSFLAVLAELHAGGIEAVVDRLVGNLYAMPSDSGHDPMSPVPLFSVVLSAEGAEAEDLLEALPDARAAAGPGTPGVVTVAPRPNEP